MSICKCKIFKMVILVVLGIMLCACGSRIDPYDGVKAYYFGDYNKAFKVFSQACDKNNDPFMCYSVAGMYDLGIFVEKDEMKAYKFYVRACEGGIGLACSVVGKKLKDGQGVQKNLFKALQFYVLACQNGFASGCFSAASMYYNKEGVKENRANAKELFRMSCVLGDQKGCEIYKKLSEAGY